MDAQQIGKYRVERTLGSGGFARVLLCRDPDLDKYVAVKILADIYAENEDVRRRFVQEARILSQLDHERVLRVHYVDQLADGRPYFVADYADRGTLRERIEAAANSGTLIPLDEALRYAHDIGQSLAVAHARQIAHRDLKPSNVLFRTIPAHHRDTRERYGSEITVLADFGIARAIEQTSHLAKASLIAGTVPYMAPEQLEGMADQRCDIYAASVILYELLTGSTPFEGATDPEVHARKLLSRFEPVSSLRPDAPSGMDALISKGLAPEPAERFQSAEEWSDRVAALATGAAKAGEETILAPSTSTSVTPVEEESPRAQPPPPDDSTGEEPPVRARLGVSALLVLLLAMAVVAGIVYFSGRDEGTVTTAPAAGPTTEAPTTTATTSLSTTVATSPLVQTELALATAVATAEAPDGVDAAGNSVTYTAANVIDGDPTTAWRAPGEAIGERISMQLAEPAEVTRVGLIPGYAKVDPFDGTDRFTQNRTVEIARWTFDDGTEILQDLSPVPELQFIDVTSTETRSITLEIVASSEHGGRDYTAISEIVVVGLALASSSGDNAQVFEHVFPLDPPDAGSFGQGGHSYPATDIFAPVGTRFVAVTSGTIEAVSLIDEWDPEVDDGASRGGLWVSLLGDDGVRYYGSHLSGVAQGIEAGVRVAAGQLLGLVGRSGNARDTPSHLHFGISAPSFPEDWQARRGQIDPFPFLNAWLAGDTELTPEVGSG